MVSQKRSRVVNMSGFSTYVSAGLFIAFLYGCSKDDLLLSAVSLDKLNWSEKNYQVLYQFINDNGQGGKYYDNKKPPYIVLDWDQTCAHFDAEEAVMRFELTNLRFALTKDQFRSIIKDNINGVMRLSEAYQNVLLADINKDLINDYDFLFDNFLAPSATMTLSEIQTTPQYNDFIVKIPFLYEGYCDTQGIGAEYGYPWVLYLLAGHSLSEVRALANEAISFELGNKLGKQVWQSPAGFETNVSGLSYSFKSGLRVFPEMQNLIAAFKSRGIDVFIVSASYKPIVETFSGIGTFGYNVPAENVIAMELAIADGGIILPEYKAGWIVTQRQGKVDAINRVIKQDMGKNWDPIFSAGDSDGDFEMSTAFPGMTLTLIWNRLKAGDIGKLCKQAVDEVSSSSPRYILQGRNENTGIVMPSSESMILGETVPRLLHSP